MKLDAFLKFNEEAVLKHQGKVSHEVALALAEKGANILALEVKSGARSKKLSGLKIFKERYPKSKTLVIGNEGVPLMDFFKMDKKELFEL